MILDSAQQNYWLFDWLDAYNVTDLDDLRTALDSRSAVTAMRDYAIQWKGSTAASGSECNLIAGSGLGHYDGITCPSTRCRKNKVDVLFRHAWHYFDHIYMPDAAGDLLRHCDDVLDNTTLKHLKYLLETSMYLRQIGAQSLVRYYSSDALENETIEVLEAEKWEGMWAELGQQFLSHPDRYRVQQQGRDNFEVSYDDPELRFSPLVTFNLRKIPKGERKSVLRAALTKKMVEMHRRSFTDDLVAATTLRGSLGSTTWTHQWALEKSMKNKEEDGVFFQMDFPSLQNVPVADLITLRLEHKDSFIACRAALRKTVRELSAVHHADRDKLAGEIVRDLVNPEMARLSNKLEAARYVLAKKSAVALAVASVSTLCGLHFGAGMLGSFGIGTVALFASGIKDATSKYSEEKRDLEISDLSFIWKALDCVKK